MESTDIRPYRIVKSPLLDPERHSTNKYRHSHGADSPSVIPQESNGLLLPLLVT